MKVFFVLGGPGAGKGTQCEYLVEEFGFMHLSAGELLRAERKNTESKNGKLIEQFIKDGKIVPVEITVALVLAAMKASGRKLFLVDGFPRNEDNLQGWKRVVGSQAEVLGCLFFDCPEEVMEKRLLNRGETSGRSDDNIESIRKRFKTYQTETYPIIQLFQKQDKCWHIIADRSKESIRAEVRNLMLAAGIETSTTGKAQLAVAIHKANELPQGVKLALSVGFLAVLGFVGMKLFQKN